MKTPLMGRRVLVTRAVEDSAEWANRLLRHGAHPVVFPCLVSAPLADAGTKVRLLTALSTAEWLLVTSRRGVQSVADLMGKSFPAGIRIAAVGPATAHAAANHWGRVDLVATTPTSEGLATDLAALVAAPVTAPPPHAVIAGAVDGRRDAEVILVSRGWRVTFAPVYETLAAPASDDRLDLREGTIDDILLASPSAVTGLLNRAVFPCTARIITIGPTTTAAARAAGLVVAAEARRPGLEGMLEVMQ
ncbi:MAG: uroporphyrinogen-III synthase [Gemmatimonadaceae bacterium]